ncbi:PREDICTED: cholinesterase 1-like [Polistes dominula]|uniref:Carboxylic ester hydrolase n=1 Tax=Polistes dominula TaxID=743375 RepID=A0ABM1I6P5_POLDO|nr:PREDICTED: cholinesterase 1-like [Polistes dominula]
MARLFQTVDMSLIKLVLFALVGFAWVIAEEEVQVEIPQGPLKGLKTQTVWHNMPYYSFKGIPYAKPNVGVDKFRMPEPADSWEGVYDATKHRSTCPFFCMLKQDLLGDEDCLYLNVYTPEMNKDARKAVMVWIHGGSWNAGFGDDAIYGPDFLVEQDVVVVTFNYRLGALGFLNTGDEHAPGNAGMKDQVMALMWVKDNIHYFGGCPNRVTIFGQSSGGASVQYHMMSPMSEGLFNNVIAQSGAILNPWAIEYKPKEMAFKLGEKLGISTQDTGELIKKLAEFSAKDIVTATKEMMNDINTANGHLQVFVPSVEYDFGQDVFLTTDPWTLIKTGKIADVPIMGGVTLEEASFFAELMLPHADHFNNQFEVFLPDDLNVTDPTQRKQLGESIKEFYFHGKDISKDTLKEFTQMLTDAYFTAGAAFSLNFITHRNTAPVYQYIFEYEAPFGIMKNVVNSEKGIAHGDELGYEFYSNIFKNLPKSGSPEEKMTRIITKLWTNFAKDGNPTSKLDEDITINWEPKNKEICKYIHINQDLKMDAHLLGDRVPLWAELYKNVFNS